MLLMHARRKHGLDQRESRRLVLSLWGQITCTGPVPIPPLLYLWFASRAYLVGGVNSLKGQQKVSVESA